MDPDSGEDQTSFVKTNVGNPSNGEDIAKKGQQDGNRQETVTHEKVDDTESAAATSFGVTVRSGTHKTLHVSRNSDHSLGGQMAGEDDYAGNGEGKRSLSSDIQMHVINDDYRTSSTFEKVPHPQQNSSKGTVATTKKPTTIKQIQQQVDAQIQQQRNNHENRHRQHTFGIQNQQTKQFPQEYLSQPPNIPSKNHKNDRQVSHPKMNQSGPKLSVQSHQQTTVKIKQQKGRFRVLEGCNDAISCQQAEGPNLTNTNSSIPNQQKQLSKSILETNAKQSKLNSGKLPRSKSLERIAANTSNTTPVVVNAAHPQTMTSKTKTAFAVQYSSITGDTNPLGTEKKGRFIISNSVDAGKVQQSGKKLLNKCSTNQQWCDSAVDRGGRKKSHQAKDVVPQLSLQGHLTNDYGSSNGTTGSESCTTSGSLMNGKATPPKKVSSEKKLSIEKHSVVKAVIETSTVPSVTVMSHATTGGLMKGGMGKIFHFLEQMRLEVVSAEKMIKSLQSDNKFLRGKNKELEAKCNELDKLYSEEKSARESAESKNKTLKKRLNSLTASRVVNVEQHIVHETKETETVSMNSGQVICHGSDNETNTVVVKRPDDTQDKVKEPHVKNGGKTTSKRRERGDKGTGASCQLQVSEATSLSPSREALHLSLHHSDKIKAGNFCYEKQPPNPKTGVTNSSLELLYFTNPVAPPTSLTRVNTKNEPTCLQSKHSEESDGQTISRQPVQRETNSRDNSLASFDPLGITVDLLSKEECTISEPNHAERFQNGHSESRAVFHSISCTPELSFNESSNLGENFDPYKVN